MIEHEFDIAMLLATRGRTMMLDRSIRSLVDLADDPGRVQLMFAFDRDDNIGFEYFTQHLQPWLDTQDVGYTAMRFDRMGYINLHKYNNELAAKSSARWLMIWNDDAVMQSQGWDTTIMSYEGEFKLLSFKTHNMHPYSIFPIVPRTWFDLLGYISPHPTQDGWVSQQGYMLDIYQRIDVDVLHDRFDLTGNNNDTVFNNRPMLEGNLNHPMDFHNPQQIKLRQGDCAKLATYMHDQGLSTEFFENIFKGTQDPWEKLRQNDPNHQMFAFESPDKDLSKVK
jgi:hypothetical protein